MDGSERLVGTWGGLIIFRVGMSSTMTFKNWQRTVAGRYAEHGIISNVPRLEWLGPDITELTLTVELSTDLGVHVGNMLQTIEKFVRCGVAQFLWIGGKKIGTNKFVISQMNETRKRFYSDGQVTHATVDLTFREYYEGQS